MIGKLNFDDRRAVVVGAGISGLLMADRLSTLGFKVELYEASHRVGGMIQTLQTPFGISEAAAHSILVAPNVAEYLQNLGVLLEPVNRNSRSRFIWRDQKMRRFPLKFFEVLGMFFRAYFILSSPRVKTLEDWGRRHLGLAAVEYLLNPFLRGIFASRPSELSVDAAFPILKIRSGHSLLSQMILKKRTRAPRAQMHVIQGGTENLIRALDKSLLGKGVKIHLDHPVSQIPDSPNRVLCVPAPVLGSMLESVDASSSSQLKTLKYAPLISVTVFVKSQVGSPRGVGVLVPENQRLECLGILFNSSAFGDRADIGFDSYTFMFGGTARVEIMNWDDSQIRSEVEKAFEILLKIKPDIQQLVIHRWQKAIPIYGKNIEVIWRSLQDGWCARKGHVVFSNYSQKVSIRGMLETILELDPKKS